VIPGKGDGLFILLHGVPGVGKTATAEAVAQSHGKPLFKITCGDLGLTPESVESRLRHVFRLASLWDCILLLDEVDTFFTQRSKGDAAMTKNALVSVFLRILDYYNGILFMTTNRAGTLDEAFKSRIHYHVYYPPLDRNQTREIWQINIQRLKLVEAEHSKHDILGPMEIPEGEILNFAEMQFDAKAQNRWNGRQIRNAFQVARSLARADAAAEKERIVSSGSSEQFRAPRLDVKYFLEMHEMGKHFNQYLQSIYHGKTDGDLAHEMEVRNDEWNGPNRDISHGNGDHLREAGYHSGRHFDIEKPLASAGGGWGLRSSNTWANGLEHQRYDSMPQGQRSWQASLSGNMHDEPHQNGPLSEGFRSPSWAQSQRAHGVSPPGPNDLPRRPFGDSSYDRENNRTISPRGFSGFGSTNMPEEGGKYHMGPDSYS
jgi:SpoVK/Ycf46/Vps4 family AAA+-type ATPase